MKGFCDCNQGRLPCTCEDPAKYAQRVGRVQRKAVEIMAGEQHNRQWADPVRKPDPRPERLTANVEELTARINKAPEALDRGEYWCEVAMARGRQLSAQMLKIDALTFKVKAYQALALLGWAGLILKMMGV